MLGPATESLSSPCLAPIFAESGGAAAFLFVTLAVLGMHLVDYVLKGRYRRLAEQHGADDLQQQQPCDCGCTCGSGYVPPGASSAAPGSGPAAPAGCCGTIVTALVAKERQAAAAAERRAIEAAEEGAASSNEVLAGGDEEGERCCWAGCACFGAGHAAC